MKLVQDARRLSKEANQAAPKGGAKAKAKGRPKGKAKAKAAAKGKGTKTKAATKNEQSTAKPTPAPKAATKNKQSAAKPTPAPKAATKNKQSAAKPAPAPKAATKNKQSAAKPTPAPEPDAQPVSEALAAQPKAKVTAPRKRPAAALEMKEPSLNDMTQKRPTAGSGVDQPTPIDPNLPNTFARRARPQTATGLEKYGRIVATFNASIKPLLEPHGVRTVAEDRFPCAFGLCSERVMYI